MSPALRNIWMQVRAEGKKAAILGGLLVVCGALGLRAALGGKRRPTPAQPVASQPATPPGAPSAPDEGAPAAGDLDLTPPIRYAQGPAPTRDLFIGNPRWFSDAGAIPGATAPSGAKSADGIDEVSGQDGALQEAALRRRVEEDAAKCRLRSVALGARPAAVIEFEEGGERRALVVKTGEVVLGFTVEEITSAGVKLARDGWEARLEVLKPKK